MNCTVLLPVYNAGRPLFAAIQSILAQDDKEFEFLIIDDRSTDGSVRVIREFAARDHRIRAIYHVENRGLAATLNEGLELASSSLVVRMDQDDEALPHRIGTQVRFMRENRDGLVESLNRSIGSKSGTSSTKRWGRSVLSQSCHVSPMLGFLHFPS